MKYDAFFYEAFEEEEAALRRCLDPEVHAGFTRHTVQESGDASSPARLISVRTQSQIPAEWANSLSGVLSRSTGHDHMRAYRQRAGLRLPCGYLPLYCARAVAEQALLLWLALFRKLGAQQEHFDSFHRDGLTGRECEGRGLLVVGVGNIGFEIVRIGNGLGMNVLGVDIVRRHASVSYVPLEEGLAQADVVVCAMNLTDRNTGYFSLDVLRHFKPGSVFVNIARGELAPSHHLLTALDSGCVAGIGLDVCNEEGALAVALRSGGTPDTNEMRAALELRRRANVILTPHNAFNTEEAVARKAEQSARQVREFLAKGAFVWPVPE
jgi:D-lactate dehydrogenase